ncbi:hypothetical protein GmRootA79_34340 [Acidovorax sp. A79]|uniref:hypothetical protein n=1 Tax=unclassified Acidovorax TaxID=2684926 RepID=UPI001C43D4CB|nr:MULTISPECIES: hypothetical protein [unclassified Acidovorax]MBV7428858.1 hypothetical protein [Acidovorax sp. sif0732]MBV7450684.1 hypothetical protein [Acidovorax sp. sif0715]
MATPRKHPKKSDRRRQLRAEARTRAARGWARSDGPVTVPEQQFLRSCAVALLAGTVALHALGALIYGQLSIFVLEGFADLRGRVAVCAAVAEAALVAGLALHLIDGHRRGRTTAAWSHRLLVWRASAYILFAVLVPVTFVLWMVDRPRFSMDLPAQRWPGLAAQSEWLLAPLPWAWHWLLPVASDRLQAWLVAGAVLAGCLGVWCTAGSTKRWRTGYAFYGLALVLTGFWALGGAVYHYTAGRGLIAVQEAAMVALLQARPGWYNADTLLWLLSAGSFTLAGVLFIAGAAYIPAAALARTWSH